MSGAIRLETIHHSYSAADTVSLRLTNGTRKTLERAMCPPMLYKWTSEDWTKPPEWDGDIDNDGIETGCILLAYAVAPRSIDIYDVALPIDLRPGHYRFEERLTSLDRSLDTLVYTPIFVIE